MKHRICIFLVAVASLSVATAQTEKGSKLVGVNVGNIIIPTSGNGGTSIISLQPQVGWFVANGLVLGTGVPFFYVGSDNTSVMQIGLTPFVRYYIGKSSIKPFLGGSFGFIRSSLSNMGRSESSTNTVYSVSGGLAFFVNKSVSFDLGLNYTGANTNVNSVLLSPGVSSLTPGLPSAVTINLGFQVFFGRK